MWSACKNSRRRLRDWQAAGVWKRLHEMWLAELNCADKRKHHLLTDASGVPMVVILTGANVHDVKKILPLVDAIPPVHGKPGPPRTHPKRVQADTAYDSEPLRARCVSDESFP